MVRESCHGAPVTPGAFHMVPCLHIAPHRTANLSKIESPWDVPAPSGSEDAAAFVARARERLMSVASHVQRTTSVGAEQEALSWVPRDLLIGGRWEPAAEGRRIGIEDPATGVILCSVSDAAPADCARALTAAVDAGPPWATRTPRERSRVLRRASDALRERTETVALIITMEMGKPLAESRAEVAFAADYLEWYAEEAVRLDGRQALDPHGSVRHVVLHQPVGACLVVTPWNFPLAVPARGVAAALAAGCTAVLRPSSLTPLSALALARVLMDAGLPDGTLNLVVSSQDDATDGLLEDSRLRKLTFTGSEAVGRHLLARAATGVLRSSVELGGCAPFIVFADADLDAAVDGAVAAKMRNGGAACTAANRFYVQRSIAAEFAEQLAARLAGFRLGRGTRRGATLGPMIGERQRERLTRLVADAVARGARTLLAGGPLPGPGYFFRPVVLADVPDDAQIMQQEAFGPVAPIRAFADEDEVLEMANDRDSGLAAYVYTRDIDRAFRVAGRIEAGMVGVNRGRVSSVAAPFGGVKHSGFGCSGGPEGIAEYLVTRYLALAEG
jgi:succinate-semialdehyde dehydrogenase/glutarate-semialdehyde dehydrogenase